MLRKGGETVAAGVVDEVKRRTDKGLTLVLMSILAVSIDFNIWFINTIRWHLQGCVACCFGSKSPMWRDLFCLLQYQLCMGSD